jgi:hypothetical protein
MHDYNYIVVNNVMILNLTDSNYTTLKTSVQKAVRWPTGYDVAVLSTNQ